MKRLIFGLFLLGYVASGATLSVPFELGKSARAWSFLGADLALPDSLGNPGALGFIPTWEISSTYASPFGIAGVWSLSFFGPNFFGEATLVDAGEIGPALGFRVLAGQAGFGIKLSNLGFGTCARLLWSIQPKAGLGWAWDLGFLSDGAVRIGILAEAVLSQPPSPQDRWPTTISLGLSLPFEFAGFSAVVAAAVRDVPVLPTWAVAAEIRVSPFTLVFSFGSRGLGLGGGLNFSWFRLEWAFTLSPDLPLSFRVSFGLTWS